MVFADGDLFWFFYLQTFQQKILQFKEKGLYYFSFTLLEG